MSQDLRAYIKVKTFMEKSRCCSQYLRVGKIS